MTRAAVVLAALILGCGPHPAPPSTQPVTLRCTQPTDPTSAQVCESAFTIDGRPCVRCAERRACVDDDTGVYCVADYSCSDPACSVTGSAPPVVTN